MKQKSQPVAFVRRRPNGNMLFMCIAMLAVMLATIALGFGVYFLFFAHQQLQDWAETFAMNSAKQLNCNDYAGKINNLLGHSRELVFTSREMFSKTEQEEEFADLKQLSAQVLQQSRDGAITVKNERERYVSLSIDNLRRMLKEAQMMGQLNNRLRLFMPTVSACDPQITDFRVGTSDNLASNVETSKGIADLLAFDISRGYVKRGKEQDLYCANVNLKLPNADSDLDFELSPLPAPVRGITAPTRLTLGRSFKSTLALRNDGEDSLGRCRLSPSAVQVVMTLKVNESVVGKLESRTMTINTACTNGACTEP